MRAAGLVTAAGQSGAASGVAESRLVIRNARPLDAESPIDALRTFETSNDLFFRPSHHAVLPEISTPWTLTIDGEVARPVTLRLEDLRRMPAEHRSATIECAGNGAAGLELPTTSGVQWGLRRGEHRDMDWACRWRSCSERAGSKASALHFWMAERPIAVRCPPSPSSSAVFRARPRSAMRWWPTR
jgi:DMSO/TMAO reductase YedYZ molybdopterin-dependent catalytic subunit